MGTFDDSFSFELNYPIDAETWKALTDAALDNTDRVYFTTTSGKRVGFIKADVLDKIRAEIEGMYRVILKGTPKDDWAVRWNDCLDDVLQIIDKCKEESEGLNDKNNN